MSVTQLLGKPASAERILCRVDDVLRRELSPQAALELIREAVMAGVGADSSRAAERAHAVQQEKFATLGQLSASIAHEIRNPLSGIIGYTQLLKKSLQDRPQLRDDLEMIERETTRLQQLADSMMTCVRPSQLVASSAASILDMALSVLHCEVRRYGARVEKAYASAPAFECDPSQIEQVFINLLLNALQALEGRPERTVSLRVFAAPGGQGVAVEIEDTGRGILPEDLPRIFEPQFSKRQGGIGNGLGLSLVQGAVGRHGGTIEVDSTPCAGTVFRLTFPVRRPS